MDAQTKTATTTATDQLWYKDAIIYQLHVKSFFDSNGDGIGDFRGLISKLDYISELGVNTLWLLPFYPSPLLDDGDCFHRLSRRSSRLAGPFCRFPSIRARWRICAASSCIYRTCHQSHIRPVIRGSSAPAGQSRIANRGILRMVRQ